MNVRLLIRSISISFSSILFFTPALEAAELEHTPSSVEEIVVTSTLHRSQADTTLPVNVLTVNCRRGPFTGPA